MTHGRGSWHAFFSQHCSVCSVPQLLNMAEPKLTPPTEPCAEEESPSYLNGDIMSEHADGAAVKAVERLKRQNAIKVIKGEIHNVLATMRTDARYASPRRFLEETVVEDHPLLHLFRELHQDLSVHPLDRELQVTEYLSPFCGAISGRDISASVTGCALSSLHKFLLYGFIRDSEGMTLTTKALLHCSFEQESAIVPVEGKRRQRLHTTTYHEDEQVVLKLLSLAGLVVRYSLGEDEPLLDAKLICGLLDTCLHVSHRSKDASPLLRSAASDSLSQIVLVVFSTEVKKVRLARCTILRQLANLVNPLVSTDATCVTSLTLINIALETMQTITVEEVEVLQDQLCKHLLTWSTTNDLIILSLTLRVIFNLFQPMLRNQMKVPLEVFLTSVHIRILDQAQRGFSMEQQEAGLESLLEFCQEPSLMHDLYLNYDCDMNCSNLFDTIMTTLVASAVSEGPWVMSLNKLAVEGILSVMEAIARKCGETGTKFPRGSASQTETDLSDLSDTDDEEDEADDNGEGYDQLGSRWETEVAHKVAQERKRKKHVVHQVAQEFNRNNRDWMLVGEELGLFPQALSPSKVAAFLYNTPSLDKTLVGLHLSKGPPELYPSHAEVRSAFCSLFDFKALSFSESLRTFIEKFRLPGEAQCIDRLMEAFASEMFDQQQGNPVESPLFNSSDAVFRMAFSTIMLNTDLHNPGLREEKRMKVPDFIRNNRGLNDDEDFPEEFLTELYEEIKSNELQVQKEFMEVTEMLRQNADQIPAKHWEGIMKRNIEAPFFTPAETAPTCNAGVHDRDMFVSIVKTATHALSNAFAKSRDDHLVIKILKGFRQMAKICVYFDLDETFNDILQVILGHGRDYIMSCIALEYAGLNAGLIMAAGPQSSQLDDDENDDSPPVLVEGINVPMPKNILQKSMNFSAQSSADAVEGSAAHRGLLALDCGFTLIRTQPSRLREAWPTLIECLCGLRDARALPDRVIFLDDFADSRGNLLPLSPFAKQSQQRLDEYYRSLSGKNKRKGWLGNVFSAQNRHASMRGKGGDDSASDKELSSFSYALLQVTQRAKLEQVVIMRPKNLPLAKQTIGALLDAIDAYPYFDDPIFEQHAVYSLELALLALISNRDRAPDLYDLFLAKFDSVLSTARSDGIQSDKEREKNLPTPFLMERVVVTILRSCIHLYDIPDVRPQLRICLRLLMDLPATFTRYVSDRMACGMAIFLSQKFSIVETTTEWSFIGDMLDQLAFFGPGRGFVFDGIANIVESQLAPTSQIGDERQLLPLEGAQVLAKLLLKFIFGTYQNDMSLCVPAMLCMENLYRHTVMLSRTEPEVDNHDFSDPNHSLFDVPDEELWKNIAVAYYSVCRQPDPMMSRQGADCFQRFIASTKMSSLPDDTWLTLLHLIVLKQPPVSTEDARVNCCSILAKVLLMSIAHLSGDRCNWEDLSDIVNQMVILVGENLREGRRGTVSPLFESTLQSITFLSNHMVSEEFTGDAEYGTWVSETLLSELEKVGAGGGSIKNVTATRTRMG